MGPMRQNQSLPPGIRARQHRTCHVHWPWVLPNGSHDAPSLQARLSFLFLKPAGISRCIEPGASNSSELSICFFLWTVSHGKPSPAHPTVTLPRTLGRRIPAPRTLTFQGILAYTQALFCLRVNLVMAWPLRRTFRRSPRPRLAVTATLGPLLAAPWGATRPGSLEPSPSETSRPL